MKKKVLILIIISASFAFFKPDTEVLKSLIQYKLNDYAENNYPEKIYIHTDKPYYTAGESVWFSSYLVNGITHKVSEKSLVIYIDLVDEKDSIISRRKLFTEDLSVAGDIKLPLDLKGGNYLLRGYTNYMRNQGNDYFFKKNIKVYDIETTNSNTDLLITNDEQIVKKSDETHTSQDIGFYPEGGYLVNGISSKIAIKVENKDLNSNSLKGIIVDNEGVKITDFETYEFGLGSFYLKPEATKKYRAIVTTGNTKTEYPLPTPLQNGYVLNASLNKDNILIEVTTTKKEGLKDLLIIGHQRGTMAFDYTENRAVNTTMVKIPKEDLTDGILEIALFNNAKQPIAERLMFINKENEMPEVSILANSDQISTREKVILAVDVKDKKNASIPSTMSISITDATTITNDKNAENIKTWLLLNADLKGKIDSPNYFFSKNDKIKKQYLLDLTMMTHGWSRFTWQEFLENPLSNKYTPEKGIYITGNTLSTNKPYSNKKTNTKLTFKYDGIYQEEKRTDDNGVFSYGPYVYNDSIDVIIQATETSFMYADEENSTTRINIKSSIDIPEIKQLNKSKTVSIKNDNLVAYKKSTLKLIESNYKFDQEREILGEVFIKTQVKTPEEIADIERNKRTKHFRPQHRIIADSEEHIGSPDVSSLLLNIPQLKIERGDKGGITDLNIHISGGQPTLLLDNIRVDSATILGLNKDTIDFIDVIRSGPGLTRYPLEVYGVIAVFTKRGSREGKLINKNNGTLQYKNPGFYSVKEFYAPDYSKETHSMDREDIRSTLHWEPTLSINGKNSEMSFYTSDLKGPYLIQIEGITNTGIPFYKTETIIVE